MSIQKQGGAKDEKKGTDVRRCVRCIVPVGYPEVQIDAEGVCNFCRAFDKYWGSWMNSTEEQARSEAKLRQIFRAAQQKKRPYDILIGLSGGKDSSYMLYLCHEVFGLNVLTFTNDSGILTDEAKSRIDHMVKRYGVRHIYSSEPLFRELAGVFMRKTGNFCAVCELSNYNLGMSLVREYDIPLFAVGSSSRTEAGAPKYLNPWDPWYFKNVLKGEPFRERIRLSAFNRNYLVLDGIKKLFGRSHLLLMPDYLPWDNDKISEMFRREFGFEFGDEHSDCLFHKVAEYSYSGKYDGHDPRTAKLALSVRTGLISREAALEKLKKPHIIEPIKNLDRFLTLTGLTSQEFEEAVKKTPAAYLGKISRLFNFIRKKIRRQAG